MAPERLEKDDSFASDIFSLGSTLYDVISGKTRNSRLQVSSYTPLSESDSNVPRGIDDLILDCISEKPEERPKSVLNFVSRLRNVVLADAPLEVVLYDGTLYELGKVLKEASVEDFEAWRPGPRAIIKDKFLSLLRSSDKTYRGTIDMIQELTRLATSEDYYSTVIEAAFEWGFEKEFMNPKNTTTFTGDPGVRKTLAETVLTASKSTHQVIENNLIKHFEEVELSARYGWYYYDLRAVVTGLLLSKHLNEESLPILSEILSRINQSSELKREQAAESESNDHIEQDQLF